MFLSGIVLALGLDQAIFKWQVDEALRRGDERSRQAQAVLAQTQKTLQEHRRLTAEIERLEREWERQDLRHLDFVRKYGPLMPREAAEIMYGGAEDLRKKYGQPPFPPLPPPDK